MFLVLATRRTGCSRNVRCCDCISVGIVIVGVADVIDDSGDGGDSDDSDGGGDSGYSGVLDAVARLRGGTMRGRIEKIVSNECNKTHD